MNAFIAFILCVGLSENNGMQKAVVGFVIVRKDSGK